MGKVVSAGKGLMPSTTTIKGRECEPRTRQTGIKTKTWKGREIKTFPSLDSNALLLVSRVVFNFGIDGDLHIESTVVMILDNMFTLGVKNAALTVAVNLDTLFANVTDGVGLIWVRVDVENRVGGVSRVRAGGSGTSSGGVGTRVRTRESSTGHERTTDGENDTHGHGGGENGSHTIL